VRLGVALFGLANRRRADWLLGAAQAVEDAGFDAALMIRPAN
jgi:hypothetical protein